MSVRRTVMLGAFPPPVGGAAKVNGLVYDALRSAGVDVSRIDVAAASLGHRKTLRFHAERIWRNLTAMVHLRKLAGNDALLYLVPDAGAGAWYTLGHALGGANGYGTLVIHHHSCRYIRDHSRPIASITNRYRGNATHVFLTQGMAEGFQARYGEVTYLVASNARFVAEEARRDQTPRSGSRVRIGHLSNLSHDKGFFRVADAFDDLRKNRVEAELHIAGPPVEPDVQPRLARLSRDHPERFFHHGSVSGERKREFYRGIDLFVFPTEFPQEAAPIVVYEALSAGIPVISTTRGQIAEIVLDGQGRVLQPGYNLGAELTRYIVQNEWSEPAVLERGRKIKAGMQIACAKSEEEYTALLRLLGVDSPTVIGSS